MSNCSCGYNGWFSPPDANCPDHGSRGAKNDAYQRGLNDGRNPNGLGHATDDEIKAFRAGLVVSFQTQRCYTFSDPRAQLVDYCNRALGDYMHTGQTWREAVGFSTSHERYQVSEEARSIVERAIHAVRGYEAGGI